MLTDRLFGLDAQLLADAAITALNVFVLFVLLSYLLFNPVRRLIRQRQEGICQELETADKSRQEAERYRAEYEERLRELKETEGELLREAAVRAKRREDELIARAGEEAERIRERARQEGLLIREAVRDDMKREIITTAALMAQTILSSVLKDGGGQLIEEAMQEMSESTWKQ